MIKRIEALEADNELLANDISDINRWHRELRDFVKQNVKIDGKKKGEINN